MKRRCEIGYLKIPNLYHRADLLECYALEKCHGTSSHILYKNGELIFYAGGASHAVFVALFDVEALKAYFTSKFRPDQTIFVYGEAFGGSMQGMSAVYGKELRFIAFDVKIDDVWLDVPSAAGFVEGLGLQFVPYERGPMTVEWLDEQRDRPSLVAVVENATREGIVIRPIYESTTNDGKRIIAKHKHPKFRETKTVREVDPAKAVVLSEAKEVADEWVVPMRLDHVLQRTSYGGPQDTHAVIVAMVEDVKAESANEIVWSKEVERAIGRATVDLLHKIR
jgi:hypothetical protein